MIAISIGPVALPVAPLLLGVSLWLGASLARRLAPADVAARADNALWIAALAGLLAGLLAARAGYVAQHADAYLAHPGSIVDLRDGGFWWPAGLVGGGGWLAWRAWALPTARGALGRGALAGTAIWLAFQAALFVAGGGQVRAPTPDLAVTNLASGRLARLPELTRGQPTVINLWASWCAPCRAEMPTLAAAQRGTPGVRFLFVNQGEPPEKVAAYLGREGLALEDVWLDPGSALGPAMGSSGLPTTVFFNARGERVDAHFGMINAPALQARLQDLLAR